MKVAGKIAERQRGFFLNADGLIPMQLSDLAQEIGVHPSTVSRAVQGKYLKCSRGIYPLKFFFAKAVHAENEKEASSQKIKSRLESLLKNEDVENPYTDAELCALLCADSQISRRTVAKYRAQLGYASTSERKRRIG